MIRLIALSLLLVNLAVAQEKQITPLTGQEASSWKELNRSIADTEAWLRDQKERREELKKADLAAHKIKQGPCVSVDIIDGYILYEPSYCYTVGSGQVLGSGPNGQLNWVTPVVR